MTSDLIQRRVRITGRVQGVGFHAATAQAAGQFAAVRGFVRNLADGRVEAVFQGPELDVLAMMAWCRMGPSGAQVTGLEVIEEACDAELPAFHVQR